MIVVALLVAAMVLGMLLGGAGMAWASVREGEPTGLLIGLVLFAAGFALTGPATALLDGAGSK